MVKRNLIVLLLILMVLTGWGQSNSGDYIPKIIPPSPNAAALEKFSNIPIDYSTGVPSISYPMWSWERGKLKFSIGLSYHAGGHKVDDMPSNVGLGWSLNGIGRISRTVRGLSDDDGAMGYMYTDTLPAVSTYAYNGEDYYYTSQSYATNMAIPSRDSPYSNLLKQVVENKLDGEQDVFSYSFGGSSGKFIIDKNGNIIPLEHTKIKIEKICNPMTKPLNGNSGRITSFKITADNGIVYKFEYQEWQYSTTYANPEPLPPIPTQGYASGWLLTKIIDPNTSDSIVITHGNSGTGESTYETGFTESMNITVSESGLGAQAGSNTFSSINVNDLSPMLVTLPDGSTVSFGYDFSRADLLNSKALTGVTVKNYQNSVIKKFHLNYSYFVSGSGVASPVWDLSGNDYSKRLKLDSIDDISSDSGLVKPTRFTYNPTLLNSRGSTNIDYWGYNVNPARNNSEYAPEIPLNGAEQAYALRLAGADRRPDSTYVRAAVLEKIQYPTGGYTAFEYECNTAFSPIKYYENKQVSNTPQWLRASFGQFYTLQTPSRVDTAIEFQFKTEEFDPRPPPDPNGPFTCLDDLQDLATTRFEITSTDASFSTYVEDTYAHFLGGIKKIISLPVGKVYRVKFVYDSYASCTFVYPFKAYVTGTYYITPQDKLAGGLRIKKITANDGSGNVLTKQYQYTDTAGHSSAVFTDLTRIPNFGYFRLGQANMGAAGTRIISRTSNPTNTLNFNGAPLIYSRVIEKESDSSRTEREYDPLVFADNGGQPDTYPYPPVQDFPNLSGMMTKQIVRDSSGVAKTEETLTYNKFKISLVNQADNRNLKTGTISSAAWFEAQLYVVVPYFMYTSRAEVARDETKVYEGASTLTTVQDKTYDTTNYYPRTVTTKNSNGEYRREEYKYSTDTTGGAYTSMIDKNMLNSLILKTVYKPDIVNVELSRSQTNFSLFQSSALPMPGTIKNSLSGNPLITDITFDSYDNKGNILQYTAKDGIVTSFFWGYHQQYPVARISGKSYNDAVTQSGINLTVVNEPASDAVMRTELNKLRSLSGCLVSTLTYKPLVGATSETTPNGITTYYEYDAFNRMSLVRDKDSNIIKKVCYNYWGQPETCGPLFGNVQKSGLFTRNNCAVGGTADTVAYTVAAGTYTSYVSQAAADQQAIDAVNANGQAYANSHGSCTWNNAPAHGNFTRNNCTGGATGSTVPYLVPSGTYTSTISQADANQKAADAVAANGQTYANANGTCSWFNVAQSASFTRNNCPLGSLPAIITYTIPDNTYSSMISQADANQKALDTVNANGQAYANANGTCIIICVHCIGVDRKCFSGTCETGVKVYTNSYYDTPTSQMVCVYHYEFSDGSWSPDQYEYRPGHLIFCIY